MKFIQTDNQIVIRMNGASQVIIGAIFLLIGAASGVGGFAVPKKSTATVTVSSHAGLYVSLIGLAFFLVGALLLMLARNRATTIVKGGDTTVSSKRVLGGHQVQQSFPTSTIVGVRLATYLDSTGANAGPNMNNNSNGGNQRRSQLTLVLQNNDLVEVANKSNGGGVNVNGMNVSSMIMKAPLSKEAAALASFLNVPLDSSDMSSISGAIKTVRDTLTGNNNQVPPNVPSAALSFAQTEPVAPAQPSAQSEATPVSQVPEQPSQDQ